LARTHRNRARAGCKDKEAQHRQHEKEAEELPRIIPSESLL